MDHGTPFHTSACQVKNLKMRLQDVFKALPAESGIVDRQKTTHGGDWESGSLDPTDELRCQSNYKLLKHDMKTICSDFFP